MKEISIALFISLFIFLNPAYNQPNDFRGIDSARKRVVLHYNNDSVFLKSCFYIAEEFMSMNMYDSGQAWLNQIAARLPLRKPSFFNFYLSVDQAETYYYNGLTMMYLQESQRMLRIAEVLRDSILLATANNFLGLAYMNIDSIRNGIPYFKDGIRYARQPPYPPQYLSASKPHHLYGNLAEAYYKLGKYDSAMATAYMAKKLALEIPWPRGIAVSDNMLGLIYAAVNKFDSAIIFQSEAIDIGLNNEQKDVSLIAYSAAADCYWNKGLNDSALNLLSKGFSLLKRELFINHFFAGQFLDNAIVLYKKLNQGKLLVNAIEIKMQLAKNLVKQNDVQITTIVNASIANETRAAHLETEDAKQKQALSNTRFIVALLLLISMTILFFLNRYYHKKQLKEVEIRNRISQDLHDDIGATLSSIQIYGELAHEVLDQKPDDSKDMLSKVTGQTKELMSRMGDVIWSMKTIADDKNSFTTRLKNFSNELLAPKDIACEFNIDEEIGKKINNPVTRKDIMLIVKEAMNNIAKYSEASKAVVSLKREAEKIKLSISDNGKGYLADNIQLGNGLQNMRQRCRQLNGTCNIHSVPGQGVSIECIFPIAIISHSVNK